MTYNQNDSQDIGFCKYLVSWYYVGDVSIVSCSIVSQLSLSVLLVDFINKCIHMLNCLEYVVRVLEIETPHFLQS